ncbi:MAG: N-acetyltransferase family protein [Phycisphaerales bacterium]
MPGALNLRSLEERDRDQFFAIARQVADEGDSYPFDDDTTEAEFLDYWFAKGEIRVAVDGERVVGGYLIKPNQPWRGSHVANVGYVVDRALRGRGIGRVLVRDSIARARELGYRAIQFNLVVVSNVGAVRLYESEGFQIIGTVPGIFRVKDGRYVDAHVMHLDLTDDDESGAKF